MYSFILAARANREMAQPAEKSLRNKLIIDVVGLSYNLITLICIITRDVKAGGIANNVLSHSVK